MRTRTTLLFTSGLLFLASSAARAQDPVYVLGAQATNGDAFGHSVADLGDVDLDGVPDVLVGAPFDDANGTDSGSVFAYSGATGALLWTRSGLAAGDFFGWSIDGLGDINGDGRGDAIVGAPGRDFTAGAANGGAAYILHGLSGGVMNSYALNELNAQLGYDVCGLGDVDGDGVGDVALSVPYRDQGAMVDAGFLIAYSGATNAFLFGRYGTEAGGLYGYSIDVIRATGSQTGSRMIIGAPGVDGAGIDRGQGQIIDCLGAHKSYFNGSTDLEWYGASAAGVGDVDGDGVRDFAFGSPYADVLGVGADAGVVRIYSGLTLAQLANPTGASAFARFGWSVAGVDDFDGNGLGDVLIGAPFDSSVTNEGGETRLVAGLGGATIRSWTGGVSDRMGQSVSPAGDLNGDDSMDIVFGARDAPFGAGEAYVHLARLDAPAVYCTAKLNSQGCAPAVATSGTPSLSIAGDFHVTVSQVINNKLGIAIWGFSPNTIPLGGGLVCLTPHKRIVMGFSGGNLGPDDCSGSFDLHVSQAILAAEPVAPGARLHVQFWSRDTADAFGISLSNAVAFDVVP